MAVSYFDFIHRPYSSCRRRVDRLTARWAPRDDGPSVYGCTIVQLEEGTTVGGYCSPEKRLSQELKSRLTSALRDKLLSLPGARTFEVHNRSVSHREVDMQRRSSLNC